MNQIFFHNWYYSDYSTGKLEKAIEAIRQNISSFPFGGHKYEIASAEAKAGGDHYGLLLFLVSSDVYGDNSAVIREKIETWLDAIGVSRNDDRTTMTAKFDTLQECLDNAYRGAYTLHDVICSDIHSPK